MLRLLNNVGRVVRFRLEGMEFGLRLVDVVEDVATELNVESPVGRALREAQAGDSLTVRAPGGNVVVNVLGVD